MRACPDPAPALIYPCLCHPPPHENTRTGISRSIGPASPLRPVSTGDSSGWVDEASLRRVDPMFSHPRRPAAGRPRVDERASHPPPRICPPSPPILRGRTGLCAAARGCRRGGDRHGKGIAAARRTRADGHIDWRGRPELGDIVRKDVRAWEGPRGLGQEGEVQPRMTLGGSYNGARFAGLAPHCELGETPALPTRSYTILQDAR